MIKYQNALVLGLGRSGAAAARLLRAEGTAVTLLEQRTNSDLECKAVVLRAVGVAVILAAECAPAGPFDVVVISPGIPRTSAWVAAVSPPGAPVIAELELGATRCRCPLLAITGSNGKSTLTKLCTEGLIAAGRHAVCGGNYGTPLCELAPQSAALDWIVVEVSSFQLEAVDTFRPRVGVLLNIHPNHLDRHGDLDTYAALKGRLFQRMARGDTAVVLDELETGVRRRLAAAAPDARPAWVTFGTSPAATYRHGDGAIYGANGVVWSQIRGTHFDNPVLGPSVAAAAAALQACGVGGEALAAACARFEALPHRMTDLGQVRGVGFVNDSKATTLAALGAGVQMARGPVRLIAGGLLKENDLESVQEILAKRVCAVYLIGKAASRLEAAWSGIVACRVCGELEQAVRMAWREAQCGETVLLSPGCASFDQFKSFEERGERFASFVRRIREEAGNENMVGR